MKAGLTCPNKLQTILLFASPTQDDWHKIQKFRNSPAQSHETAVAHSLLAAHNEHGCAAQLLWGNAPVRAPEHRGMMLKYASAN